VPLGTFAGALSSALASGSSGRKVKAIRRRGNLFTAVEQQVRQQSERPHPAGRLYLGGLVEEPPGSEQEYPEHEAFRLLRPVRPLVNGRPFMPQLRAL
jgi:hypothetical protein